MGRISAPAGLKLVNGRSPGKDSGGRTVPEAPKFNRGAPEAPESLSDEARAEWDRIVPGLDRLDLLKPEDHAALVEHCECWSTYVAALALVRRDGIVLTNPDNGRIYKNPALAAVEAASSQLRASCREFGLTPSAEQNLAKAPSGGGEQADPFASTGS